MKTQMVCEGEYCEILSPDMTTAYEIFTSEQANCAKLISLDRDVCGGSEEGREGERGGRKGKRREGGKEGGRERERGCVIMHRPCNDQVTQPSALPPFHVEVNQ